MAEELVDVMVNFCLSVRRGLVVAVSSVGKLTVASIEGAPG